MNPLLYGIHDASGKVLVPLFTDSFWDACVVAREQARTLNQPVRIVSDDPDDRPFEVKVPEKDAVLWPPELLRKVRAA